MATSGHERNSSAAPETGRSLSSSAVHINPLVVILPHEPCHLAGRVTHELKAKMVQFTYMESIRRVHGLDHS
jgi:hypothetical protein